MFHLFIDTNVFLSLYHFTTDELVELDKLRALLKQKKACLYLPEQTRLEFKRNRDNKIADALRRLREHKFGIQYPQFCRDYPEYAELRKLEGELEKKFTALIASASAHIDTNELGADKAIEDLFQAANKLRTTPAQIAKAQLRMSLGSPPGKGGSLGDAINWEALLEAVPACENLVFISGDRDYVSPLKDDAFHSFLQDEWQSAKNAEIIFYKRLASFFKDFFPNSPLATDLEKEALIKDLAASGSFAVTHSVIARLSTYTDFNRSQRNQLFDAALSNNQVYLIAEDQDVREFLGRVIQGHESELDSNKIAEWKQRAAGKPITWTDDDEDHLRF